VAVALAGPASNLVMASIMGLAFRGLIASGLEVPDLVLQVCFGFVWYNVALAIFNLIPIPPLDGSSILFRFMPLRSQWQWRPILNQYGLIVLILFIFSGGRYVALAVEQVARFLVGA
jgi:Zn-dependent protease